jgi:hypothetical protein
MTAALYLRLADLVVLLHVGFVLFVMLGGLLVLRWPRLVWVHVPAAAWGTWVELAGLVCPLTPFENWLRAQGGGRVYTDSFVEQYLLPLLYPASLSRERQWLFGAVVIVLNIAVYAVVARRRTRR